MGGGWEDIRFVMKQSRMASLEEDVTKMRVFVWVLLFQRELYKEKVGHPHQQKIIVMACLCDR